ncbi:MAG: hypothetical protein QNM02_12060 [Acidimicrobiia bacterium]|nr:hypothetical protein [Acidimicrobiia bacterium]
MNPTTDRPGRRRATGITADLDREWDRLRRDPRVLRSARRWSERGLISVRGPLAGLLRDIDDLDEIVTATHRDDHRTSTGTENTTGRTPAGFADEVLLELVAARSEQLAGRVVLQRVLPGLLSRSRRYVDARLAHETADLVVAAAWVAIRAYDHERRPRQVAAALISDAVFAAFRQPHRRHSATEQTRSLESWARQPAAERSVDPIEELADVVEEAQRRGVESHHLDLLRGLVRTGSAVAVAAELGVTDRTIRTRRDRAVEHVRHAVLAA